MSKQKRTFLERLTGSVRLDEDDYDGPLESTEEDENINKNDWITQDNEEGQLTVDVYQNPDEIIIKTMVAGVRPDNLDITITRDMVTIRGKRESVETVIENDYFYKELYWGGFARTISLPEEIDPDQAEAVTKHGLLTLRLPKLDKSRTKKIRVKSA